MAPLGAARPLIIGGSLDAGKLEHIQTQTISTDQSSVNFTSIKEDVYSIHLLTIARMKPDGNNKAVRIELSNDGGSNYHNSSGYYWSFDYMKANGTFQHKGAANDSHFSLVHNIGNSGSECVGGAFVYLYNLGNSAKFTTVNYQLSGITQDPDVISTFGAGKFLTAETNDALRVMFTSADIASGVFSLYGLAG